MQDEGREAGNLGDGGEGGEGSRARRNSGAGRFRLSTRFGPRGRRSAVLPRRRNRQVADEAGDATPDLHDLYHEQIRRRGEGLYTLEAWPLGASIAGNLVFRAENPGYREGAPCWALLLSSRDPVLRRALRLRVLGQLFVPYVGPLPEKPRLLAGCAWPDFLEAELGLRGLAQDLRAQGLGILVY